MTIGIIAAMQMELDGLKTAMTDPKPETISGITFTKGVIAGNTVVAAVCGIGKVFAALCAQSMILRYSPNAIINIGVAGTLTAGLRVLDIAIADKVCQHDIDTSPLGDPVGLVSGVNLVEFPANPALVEELCRATTACGVQYRTGTIASGDQFLHDSEKKRWIHETFGAIAGEMEGGSIGQVCYVNRIPFAVMRCISDGDGGGMEYEEFAPKAAKQSIDVVLRFLNEVNQ